MQQQEPTKQIHRPSIEFDDYRFQIDDYRFHFVQLLNASNVACCLLLYNEAFCVGGGNH
jgi:hypothetical protein